MANEPSDPLAGIGRVNVAPVEATPKEEPNPATGDAVPVKGARADRASPTASEAPAFSEDAMAKARATRTNRPFSRGDNEFEDYCERKYLDYCRNAGSIGDWGSVAPHLRIAFMSLIESVSKDSLSERGYELA
jgi:hypothetical protein